MRQSRSRGEPSARWNRLTWVSVTALMWVGTLILCLAGGYLLLMRWFAQWNFLPRPIP
jgi:hypothetical protein